MQFKIDENLPIEITELLINAGHNAETVNDQQLQGVTDFSDIGAYPPEEFSGIIILRVRIQAKHHVIKIFRNIIPLIGREPLIQRLWIIEETRVRIRGKDTES